MTIASTTEQPTAWLTAQPFAHRGLYDAAAGIPENSVAAFEKAIDAGYGIELDVQLTADGDAIVFHDSTLERLTGKKGSVRLYGSARLQQMKLKDSDQTIPSLSSVLFDVAPGHPLLIEAKSPPGDPLPLCFAIRRALEGYKGPVAVMSFNPVIVRWFAENAPRIMRGLVVTDGPQKLPWWARFKFARRYVQWRAKPQFLAYDIQHLPSEMSVEYRWRGIPVLTWTVRTDEDRARAAEHADNIIFEPQPPATTP